MTPARARKFVEAVAAHDFEVAEELLDADVETVTPRGSVRGIAACRQVLEKAGGDNQFAVEQAAPQFEDVDGDVLARTRETARWRETGEVAYERDFALRLTLDGNERIVRIMVMPGGEAPGTNATDDPGGHKAAAETHELAAQLHEESADLHEHHAAEMREKGHPEQTERAERIADHERELADQARMNAERHRRDTQD